MWEAAREFASRCVERTNPSDPGWNGPGRVIHDALMAATFATPAVSPPRRSPSISILGSPLVYSFKARRRPTQPEYRVLFEPGGQGLTVPDQIDWCLRTVAGLIERLGWETAVATINRINRAVFPSRRSEAMDLWGGMWLGLIEGERASELRIYVNLRHGDVTSRWQRVADVMSHLGDRRLEDPFRDLLARTWKVGWPVGLGTAYTDGRLIGLRLYVVMSEPREDAVVAAQPPRFRSSEAETRRFCRLFTRHLGPFRPRSVNLGFDFAMGEGGHLEPGVQRFKVEASCQGLPSEASPRIDDLRRALFDDFGLDASQWDGFQADLGTTFRAWATQYLSLGIREEMDHITTYVEPVTEGGPS